MLRILRETDRWSEFHYGATVRHIQSRCLDPNVAPAVVMRNGSRVCPSFVYLLPLPLDSALVEPLLAAIEAVNAQVVTPDVKLEILTEECWAFRRSFLGATERG